MTRSSEKLLCFSLKISTCKAADAADHQKFSAYQHFFDLFHLRASANNLEHLPRRVAPFALHDCDAESRIAQPADHFGGALIVRRYGFDHHLAGEELAFQIGTYEVARSVASAVAYQLDEVQRTASSKDVAQHGHVDHDLKKSDKRRGVSAASDQEKDSERSEAHVGDSGAEYEQSG